MYKKKKAKKNKWLVIMFVGILLLSMSYFVLKKKTDLTIVESMMKDGGLFIQKIILKPFSFLKQNKDNELEKLKEDDKVSEALKVKNTELEYQIQELKKTLELNTLLSDKVYLNATAINRNIDYWYQMITIDKGKKNGVEVNMPIVVKEGLIGIVNSVSNFNSTVKLLTSEEFNHKISVKIEIGEHYVYGILTGYNTKKKMFEIEGISENIEIPKEAIVTTTGLGENMPAGIVIGYVKDITTDNFDLAKLVEVESRVNFDALSYVTILKRKDAEA